MSLEEELSKLIEQIKIQNRKKSKWFIVKDIAVILTPIILMVGGYLINNKLNKQKEDFEIKLEEMRDSRVEAGQKIEQSKLLNTLKSSLLSTEPVERQLAINIALHACGESGRNVVAAIGIQDSVVKDQIDFTRIKLIQQLIDSDPGNRWNAAEELGTAWAKDRDLLLDLSEFVETYKDSSLAIYNSLTVLADLPKAAYIGRGNQINEILDIADHYGPNGPKTRNLKQIINQKLKSIPIEED